MTTSYDPTIPTKVDQVRLLISDTAAPWKFQNEEIQYFIDSTSNVYYAAYMAALSLQSRYSSKASTTVETVRVEYSEIAKNYALLAQRLKAQAEDAGPDDDNGGNNGAVIVTGVSIADMQAAQNNLDRPRDTFTDGQFDNIMPMRGDE